MNVLRHAPVTRLSLAATSAAGMAVKVSRPFSSAAGPSPGLLSDRSVLLLLTGLWFAGAASMTRRGGGLKAKADTAVPSARETDEELYAAMSVLVERHGYPMEVHNATTVDGYVLRMFRIPHGRDDSISAAWQKREQHRLQQQLPQSQGTASRGITQAEHSGSGMPQPAQQQQPLHQLDGANGMPRSEKSTLHIPAARRSVPNSTSQSATMTDSVRQLSLSSTDGIDASTGGATGGKSAPGAGPMHGNEAQHAEHESALPAAHVVTSLGHVATAAVAGAVAAVAGGMVTGKAEEASAALADGQQHAGAPGALGGNSTNNHGEGHSISGYSGHSTPAAAENGGGSSGRGSNGRPVVLLQHALLDSSAGWVIQGPDRSLAFSLADAGYDVWLTNVRGNRFSRRHTHLDPASEAFWLFSWNEHAAKDMPAMVDLALSTSGASTLQYVGYSQGSTIALAALSSQPALAAKVTSAALLAPVAFVTHITSLAFRAQAYMRFDMLYTTLGLHEYAAYNPEFADFAAKGCEAAPGMALAYMQALCGANPHGNIEPSLLPRVMHYLPAGTSVRNMKAWGQGVLSKQPATLSYFDYGDSCNRLDGTPQECNQRKYGQRTPPQYDLAAITTPLALFTGGQDALSDPQDIALLLKVLQPSTVALHHHEPDYAHLDFGLGHDAGQKVYPRVVKFLQSQLQQQEKQQGAGGEGTGGEGAEGQTVAGVGEGKVRTKEEMVTRAGAWWKMSWKD